MRTVSIFGAANGPGAADCCASTAAPERITVAPAAMAVPPSFRKSRLSMRESYASCRHNRRFAMWQTLREALRGTRIDYTTAPVGRAVIMLAVPMVVEMAMESIFAVADVFWVAHLGADAVATVGLTESMLILIYTAAMGVSIGATALVARRTGEHDPEGASRAAGQSILLGVGVSAAIALTAGPNARALLGAMGASPDVVATGG